MMSEIDKADAKTSTDKRVMGCSGRENLHLWLFCLLDRSPSISLRRNPTFYGLLLFSTCRDAIRVDRYCMLISSVLGLGCQC
jgi:hypothetical protein